MKKKIVVMLSLVLCLMLGISLAACKKNKHEAKNEWSFNESKHWHECATKDHDDKLDEADHAWNDGEITAEPTETAEGVKTYTCTVCKTTKTAPVEKLTHTHTFDTANWETSDTHHWHKATCEHTNEISDKAEHTFGNWTTKTPADYGVAGEEKAVCTVCGYEKTRPVEALQAKDNTITVGTIDFTYNANSQPIDSLVTAGNKEGMVVKYVGVDGTEYAESTTAPTNAGTYQYTVTIPATAEWKAAEASGKFTIAKYELTVLYEKTHTTKEYDGNAMILVEYKSLDGPDVNIVISMKSKDAGTEIDRIQLPGLLKNNYTYDQSKVKAEIVPKKLSNLTFEIEETNVDTMTSEQTIKREIAGANGEKIVVVITFNPEDLMREEGLELSFDGKGGATCIIKFQTESPNYVLDLTRGELKLVRAETV